ncbi:MAG: transcriptional repressor [Firmicutes bacterium]|nr:transcriptional repressor [Bacillota bacterium]
MNNTINEVSKKLRAQEYKLTPQREKILRVMLENKDKHLSADEVYILVKEKSPDVGLATVYRTMELFLDNDIIHSVNFGDGCKRYEYGGEKDGHHHHHAICLECGDIIEIDEDLLEDLEAKVSQDKNFQITNHELKLFGYCKKCAD